MKRGNFIRELVNAGCYLKRHGKKHDIYVNPGTGKQAPVPLLKVDPFVHCCVFVDGGNFS